MFNFHFDTDKLISQLTYNAKDTLLFNSGFFLFFFCVFLLGYQFLYKRKLLRVVYFTLFSLYFFYKGTVACKINKGAEEYGAVR